MLMALPELEFRLISIDRVTADPGIWLTILSPVAVQKLISFLDKRCLKEELAGQMPESGMPNASLSEV